MATINEHYNALQASYLFSDIKKRVEEFRQANPAKDMIKLGIGDVTKPLPPVCINALHQVTDEMAREETFHGYGPYEGYLFLREKIVEHDYKAKGLDVLADEVFVSDGTKTDAANVQEIFSSNTKVAIQDPVYPVYLDTNVMAGRSGLYENGRYKGIFYLDSTKANGFIPDLPDEPVDLIYLCFPNNPTGVSITKEQLEAWVTYARQNKSIILYDAAYEAYIKDNSLPKSIYEIEGAEEVAIEFRSFSKTAGFTGTRCSYTIVPKACIGFDNKGNKHSLHELYYRRQSTKYNGLSYLVQKAAEAVYTSEGQKQVKENIDYYMKNAVEIKTEMEGLGFDCVGGENSPYIWVDGKMDSWKFFDLLLNKAGVVCTPGAGFGRCGQGYIRISAFNSFENIKKAMQRIRDVI